jgi:hypothetical protein
MSTFSGVNGHTTTGSLGVAVIAGVGGNLAFQNFHTDADTPDLQAVLTINGDLSKRSIDLGTLPQNTGDFSVEFPMDTDISRFNVLMVKAADEVVGQVRIA